MVVVDITDTHVKVVQGHTRGKNLIITAVNERELPPNTVSNGYISDMMILAGEVCSLLAETKLMKELIHFQITSSAIIYKDITMPLPRLSADNEILEGMVANAIGISQDYNVTYTIVEQPLIEGVRNMRLAVRACPQELADMYVDLAKQSGIKLKRMTVAFNSMSRYVAHNPLAFKNHMPLMIVQQAARFVNIYLYEKSFATASRYSMANPEDYAEGVDYISRAVFDNVFHFLHFTEQVKDQTAVREMQFFGNVTDHEAFAKSLVSFDLPVKGLVRPLNVRMTKNAKATDYLNYVGLFGAFYPLDTKLENINLLESNDSRAARANSLFFAELAIAAVAGAIVVAGGYAATQVYNNNLQLELSMLSTEYETNGGTRHAEEAAIKSEALGKYVTYINQVVTAKDLYDFKPKPTNAVVKHIDEFAKAENGISRRTGISMTGYTVEADFLAKSPDDVTKFVDKLRDAGYFIGIDYTGFSKHELNDVETAALEEAVAKSGGSAISPDISKKITDEMLKEWPYQFTLSMNVQGGHSFEKD
ncbi:MAG: hypothetical protein LBN40_06280 [Oscillospiraceae bacterium]|jgi:type IV pilus assembly protein PilM|nr:hypothetical protein [Oscillospiraceae bacterium]